MPGPFVVIGPECFASADGKIVCWRGENYYARGLGILRRLFAFKQVRRQVFDHHRRLV